MSIFSSSTRSKTTHANNDLLDENEASQSFMGRFLSSHVIGSRGQPQPVKNTVQAPSNFRDPNIVNPNHALQRSAQGIPVSNVHTALTIRRLEEEYSTLRVAYEKLGMEKLRYKAERNSEITRNKELWLDYKRQLKEDEELLETMGQMKKDLDEMKMEKQQQHEVAERIIAKLQKDEAERQRKYDNEKRQLIDQQQKAEVKSKSLADSLEQMKKNQEKMRKDEEERQRRHDDAERQLIDQQQKVEAKSKWIADSLEQMKKNQEGEEERQRQHNHEKRQLVDQQQKVEAKSKSLADSLEQMKRDQERMKKDEEERQRRYDDEKRRLIDQQQKVEAKSTSLADSLEQMKRNQEKMKKDEEERQRRHGDTFRQLIDQQQKAEAKSKSLADSLEHMKRNQEKMRIDEEERQHRYDDEKRQLIDQQQKAEAKSKSLADTLERMKIYQEKMRKDEEKKYRLLDDEKKQLLEQQQKMKAEYDLKIHSTIQRQQNEEPLDGALKGNEAVLRQELKNAEGKLLELNYEIRRQRKQEQDYANRLESAEGEKSAMYAKIVELEQHLQREMSFRPQEHDTDDINNGLYAMDGANPVTFGNTWSKLSQVMRNMVDNMIARGALKSDEIQKWYYDGLVSTTIPTNNISQIARPGKRVQKRIIEHRISGVLATVWNLLLLGENVEYRAADKMFAEFELTFEEIQLLQPAPIIGSEIAVLITRTKSEFATLLLDRLPKPVDVEKALKEDPNFNPFSTLPSKITNQIIIFCNAKINAVLHALSIFAKEEVLKDWMSNIMLLVYTSVHLRLQMEAMEKQGRMVAFFAGSDNDRRAILNASQTEIGIQEPYQSVPAPRLQSNLYNIADSVNKEKRDEEFEDEYVFLTVFPGVGKVRVIDDKFVMDDQVDNQCTVLSC